VTSNMPSLDKVEATALKLMEYCKANDWSGYDPYDALNSEVFKALPFLDFRLARIVLTQALKRCPFNLRPLLMIRKTHNPKAIALFLKAFLKLRSLGLLENGDLITLMVEKLIDLRFPNCRVNGNGEGVTRSLDNRYWCWGYSFPWQTRTIIVSRGAPNLVCTSFVVNALLDLYETNKGAQYLDMAVSAGEYFLNELYWTEDNWTSGFSYPLPWAREEVHNANFLGSAVLCRIYKHIGEKRFLDPAMKVARYSASKQKDNGAWSYGESSKQRWVDNFHTGYNLCALQSISEDAGTSEFESHIRRGFEFYRTHFFRQDGAPRYFHNRTHPVDIHSVAQSIITLLAFKDLDENNVGLAHAVLGWAMANMWDEQGYFYYQVFPFVTSKIPYMRWSQAWMLVALCTLLEKCEKNVEGTCA
jgi:hypothetical protein